MNQPLHRPLKTKLYIPQPRQTLVQRQRLLSQIEVGVQRSLTLISAPPGFGKTTLLSEWAIKTSRLIAWVSLDTRDNDPARFIENLIYAFAHLQVLGPDPKSLSLAALSIPPPILLEALLDDLEILADEMVLVLDDYHLIQAQPVHEILIFLLDHLPARLHLVIATRSDPPIPLARWRARGEMTELRVDDLRFTLEEAASFLQQRMGLALDPASVALLANKTEGWISGLQLAALSLQGRPDPAHFVQAFSGTHRFILDYLVEEVVNRQPPHIQQFLLQTSILEQLSGPLCDAVLGKDREAFRPLRVKDEKEIFSEPSSFILEYLERSNLFTLPLDDDRQWYRYHHLFADLLRASLQQTTPDLVSVLHQRAATWLERNGLTVEAIRQTLAAKDYERAAELIERHGPERWSSSDMDFLGLLGQLPLEVLLRHPMLGVYQAWTLVIYSRLDEAKNLLRAISQHISASGSPEVENIREFTQLLATYISTLTEIPGEIHLPSRQALDFIPEQFLAMRNSADVMYARLLTYQGNFDEAAEILLHTAQRDLAADGTTATPICIAIVARLLLIQGRLTEAEKLCQKFMQLLSQRDRRRYYTSGNLDFALAEIWLERNDLVAVETLVREGIQHNQTWHIPQATMLGHLKLAQVQIAQGNLGAAEETLKEAASFLTRHPLPPDQAHELQLLDLALAAAQEKRTPSRAWAETLPEPFSSDYRWEQDYIILARLLIEENQFAPALTLLEQLITQAKAGKRTGRLIKILLLKSLALSGLGQLSQAFATLQTCLDLAEPEGYLRVFLDEGERARELLAAFKRHLAVTPRDYLARLLNSFPQRQINPSRGVLPQNLIEPLTPRELEVLHCLARGDSNQAIAEKLFITVSAVKKHTGNIYSKLEAESRTQAIARGREMGLI